MKIAFIVGQFPVISETFIVNQITGLLDRGHEVDIYADRPGNLEKLHKDVEAYGLLERTYYFPNMPENLVWRAVKGCAVLAKNLGRAPRNTLRALNIFKYGEQALSLWLLYTVAPEFPKGYDIVHCQFGTASFRGMAFRAIHAPDARLITIFRGHDISYFVKENGDDIYAPVFRRGDYFLANCEFFKRRVIALGCPPEQIRVHGSGLDCKRFPFHTRTWPQAGPIRIVTTGRLVEKKGIEYSIRAMAKVLEQYPNVDYRIIGDGVLRPHLEQLVDSLGIADAVTFLGQKSQAEITEQLTNAHLFVAPSVTAADGNQDAPINVLKEAMATGLPVVSTRHGGIPELVEEDVSGFLVPERDSDAIAQRLIYLIEHPQRWPAMGQAGRAFVEQHYDLDRLNDALVSLYQSLLPSEPASPVEPALTLSRS